MTKAPNKRGSTRANVNIEDDVNLLARRLEKHVSSLGQKFPGIWRTIDRARSFRGKTLDWPDWCFLPISGYLAILTNGAPLETIHKLPVKERLAISDVAQALSALAPWRVTKGIYRFHPELIDIVSSMSPDANLPVELFFHLPEWCIYVPTKGRFLGDDPIYGFFCHLEYDSNTGRRELRFLVDYDKGFIPVILHIDKGTIEEAVKDAQRESFNNIEKYNLRGMKNVMPSPKELELYIEKVRPMVSLILYLCSVNAEIVSPTEPGRKPSLPAPKRTKKGERIFPASRVSYWNVGYRIGSALERARKKSRFTHSGTHLSPRPHIRRAHWHTYWKGPKNNPEKRRVLLKWLPPIPVGVKSVDDLVPNVRNIRTN